MKPNAKGAANGKGGRAPAEAPSLAPFPDNPEFERFVDFARKIVNVPKSEIAEQERIYQEQRKRKPDSDKD